MINLDKTKIILASQSPRRCELMKQAGFEFEIIKSEVDEKITKSIPSDIVKELSLQKADDVFNKAEVEDDNGNCDEHASSGEASELCFWHGIEPNGDSPHLALLEQELGQQAVAPGPGELGEGGVDQHGL